MTVVSTENVPVQTEPDVVAVRRRVREAATKLGFSLVDQTKVVTAASELARNTVIYGGGGSMQLETLNGPRTGLRLVFEDKGPGIADIRWPCATGSRLAPGSAWGSAEPSGWSTSLILSRNPAKEQELPSRVGSNERHAD